MRRLKRMKDQKMISPKSTHKRAILGTRPRADIFGSSSILTPPVNRSSDISRIRLSRIPEVQQVPPMRRVRLVRRTRW